MRKDIIALLEKGEWTAKDISGSVGVSEKDVYEHLRHIQRSLQKTGSALVVTPAECKKCGFRFRKREKLKKPGKCPICRGESIREQYFSVR